MPSYDPSLFNVDPYYDDFSEDKKFLRLMFRPGYGVQARELTQLQTILQNQIERFGSHVFDEGSIVLDGRINENRVSYAKVLLGGIATSDDFIGTVATVSGKARARVVHAEDPLSDSSDEYGVLFFEYLDGGTTFGINDVISATAANGTGITASVTGPALGGVIGESIVVSVERGVRFVEGFFVLNSAQSMGAYSLTGASGSQVRLYQDPTTSVGFTVTRSFVSADDDISLTDPAFGFYNYAAPGSDRYKIDLVLSQRDFTPSDTSSVDNFSRVGFVEFMRIDQGEVVKVEKYPDYAMLEDTLARRTYDESGNYTVVPFELTLDGPTASGSSMVLKAQLGAGKAYVFGYEFETQSRTKLNIPCARTSAHERTVTRDFNRSVGPFVKVIPSGVVESMGATTDMGTHPSVILSSGESGAAYAPIGQARIRAISPDSGSIYNLYLYDIAMTGPSGPSGQFSDTRRIFMGGVTGNGKHLFMVTGSAGLEGEGNSLLLYQVPEGSGVTAFGSVSYAVTTYTKQTASSIPHTFTINSYTGLEFPFASSPAVSLPNADITIIDQDGRVVGGTAARGANATEVSVTVSSNTSSGKQLHVMVTQDVAQNPMSSRTKTFSTFSGTLTGQWGSALTGNGRGTTADTLYLNGYSDVIEILSLTGSKGASSGIAILPLFSFDDGQRDSFYDWSRLTLSEGITGVTGPYSATFRYYSHGAENAPFTVKSYPDYEDIPSYTSRSSGTIYSLRDCIDFRPIRNTTGEMKTNTWVPTNTAANDNDFTYTHFLPRTDKIVLTRDRRFAILSGTPSLNGDIPPDDPNAMTLYTVRVNPYTFSDTDASIRYVENKRYTMRDIGDLEKRIEAVEYYTTLSLLEQEAKSRSILDDAGEEMPKRGILVDPFKGHAVADHTDPMFAASIDYEMNELRPSFSTRSYGLTSISMSTTVGLTSEGVYTLSYSQSYEVSHLLSSGSTVINPFSMISYLGTLSLSPSTDSWYDDTKQPKVRVNVEGENDNWEQSANYGFGSRYNDWEAIWFGRDNLNDKNTKPNLARNRLLTAKTTGLSLSRVNSSIAPETMKKTVRNKTVGRDVLPLARRRTITLTAKGLRPLTSVRVYCDDVDVTPYCTGSASTDGRGEATVYFDFNAPKSGSFVEQKFLVGRHSIKVTDGTDVDSPSSWKMLAEAVYMVEGAYDSVGEDGILATRPPDTRRKSVQSERIISNLTDMMTSSGEIRGYSDPLAQTFYVDPVKYPRGIYVKSIDLYFSAKESLTSIPVTVQLRPTISGYPHPSKVLPFASSTVYSDSVSTSSLISDGSSNATNFSFANPVYLLPGIDYAICVSTNSPNYSVFTGMVGDSILTASEEDDKIKVSKQPFSRSLFKAGNTGNLVKNENEVLAFRLGVCKFSSQGTLSFSNDSDSGSSSTSVNQLRVNCSEISPEGSSISYSLSMATASPTVFSQFSPNKNVVPPNGYLSLPSANSVGGFGTVTATMRASSDGYVSPMIDLQRSTMIGVSNLINDSTNTNRGSVAYNGELDGNNRSASEAYRTKSRYITKRVVLEPGMEADSVTVSFSLCDFKRGASVVPSVDVFVRPIPVGEEDYENVGYVKLSTSDSGYSTTDDEFREVSYTNIGNSSLPKFKAFSVKVVMYGDSNGSAVPRIRNMRIVAT